MPVKAISSVRYYNANLPDSTYWSIILTPGYLEDHPNKIIIINNVPIEFARLAAISAAGGTGSFLLTVYKQTYPSASPLEIIFHCVPESVVGSAIIWDVPNPPTEAFSG